MKNYFDYIFDLPQMVNQKLPRNNFNEIMNNSERSVYQWIGLVFKIVTILFLLQMLQSSIFGGFKYLSNGSNGFNESFVKKITDEGLESESDDSYYTITLENPNFNGEDWDAEDREKAELKVNEAKNAYPSFYLDMGDLNYEEIKTKEELTINVGKNGGDDPGFLGVIANLLSLLLFAYAAFPISQVVRNAGESVAKIQGDMLRFLFRDLALIIIRAAGYVLALTLLFAAFAGVISFVFGERLFMPDQFVEFSRMLELSISVDSWSVDGLVELFSKFAAVLAVIVVTYISLPVWEYFYGLVVTLIKWLKGPYFPHKSL